LQEEVEHLNKEFALFKIDAVAAEEKVKTNLGDAKAKILKLMKLGFRRPVDRSSIS